MVSRFGRGFAALIITALGSRPYFCGGLSGRGGSISRKRAEEGRSALTTPSLGPVKRLVSGGLTKGR